MCKLIQTIAIIVALLPTPIFAQGTTLHTAARHGNTQLVIEMINAGADLRGTYGGRTALHYVAFRGHAETVTALLLNAGADASARAKDGQAAFDMAKENNQEKLKGTDAWSRLKDVQFR